MPTFWQGDAMRLKLLIARFSLTPLCLLEAARRIQPFEYRHRENREVVQRDEELPRPLFVHAIFSTKTVLLSK